MTPAGALGPSGDVSFGEPLSLLSGTKTPAAVTLSEHCRSLGYPGSGVRHTPKDLDGPKLSDMVAAGQ